MTRCMDSCWVTANDLKRCIKDGEDRHMIHLWVEATNADGEALVVRWTSHQKQPYEVLLAKVQLSKGET